MALSERHWILAAVISCGIIAATNLPPQDEEATSPPTRRTVQLRARAEASNALNREVATLVLLQRRDSAMRLLRHLRRPEGGGPRVHYDAAIPQQLRARLDSVLGKELAALGSSLSAAPVLVWVLVDAPIGTDSALARHAPVRHFGPQYVLPAQTDGRTCLSILRVGAAALNRHERPSRLDAVQLQRLHGSMLGPCAWFGMYGSPGRGVAGWLAATEYSAAMRAPSTQRAPSYPLAPGSDRVSRTWLVGEAEWAYVRHYIATDAVACAEGDLDRCSRAAGEDMRISADAHAALITGVPRSFRARAERRRSVDLGAGEPWFLASLHDEVGAEAFARFWRSDRPLGEAYASATGSTFAVATQRWLRTSLAPTGGGPWPAPLALGSQLVLAAAAVSASLLWRRRRGVEM